MTIRSFITISVILLVLMFGTHLTTRGSIKSHGMDFWNDSEEREQLHQVSCLEDVLENRRKLVTNQIALSTMTCNLLFEGKMELEEAIEELTQINLDRPTMVYVLRIDHPHASERELIARYALSKVEFLAEVSSASTSDGAERIARLRVEFQKLFPGADL